MEEMGRGQMRSQHGVKLDERKSWRCDRKFETVRTEFNL